MTTRVAKKAKAPKAEAAEELPKIDWSWVDFKADKKTLDQFEQDPSAAAAALTVWDCEAHTRVQPWPPMLTDAQFWSLTLALSVLGDRWGVYVPRLWEFYIAHNADLPVELGQSKVLQRLAAGDWHRLNFAVTQRRIAAGDFKSRWSHLSATKQVILEEIRKAGIRFTAPEFGSHCARHSVPVGDATVPQYLTRLADDGELKNHTGAPDARGRGYGLPEWG